MFLAVSEVCVYQR